MFTRHVLASRGKSGPSARAFGLIGLLLFCTSFQPVRAEVDRGEAGNSAIPTLTEISKQLEGQRQKLRSLAVSYTLSTELFATASDLHEFNGMLFVPPTEKCSLAFKGNKRFFSMNSPSLVRKIAPNPKEDPFLRFEGKMAYAYDGGRIRQRQGTTNLGLIKQRKSEADDECRFEESYCECAGIQLFSKAHRNRYGLVDGLPDSFAAAVYEVQPDFEEVDGCSCVVVVCKGRDRIWLDPRIGYLPRKREFFDEQTGLLKERRQNFAFVDLGNGVWLPKICWRDWAGSESAPAQYRGQPIYRTAVMVTKLSITDVPDALFNLEFPGGMWIADTTLLSDGRAVMYNMPADPSQLDNVIKEALASQSGGRWSRTRIVFIVLSAIATLACLLALLRRLRRRDLSA